MSDRDPLAGIADAEAQLFRMGHVARRLVAEHPELPVYAMYPRWQVDQPPALEIHTEDDAAVHQWAQLLGVEAVTQTRTGVIAGSAFRRTSADGTVDGVPVRVWCGTHLLGGGEDL